MWLWATFLVVISCIRLPMNNYQANVNINPLKMSLFFTIRQYLYWLFLLSSIIPIFQSLLIIVLIMTNTMTSAMKREASHVLENLSFRSKTYWLVLFTSGCISFVHSSFSTVMGPLIVLPNISTTGENLVLSWGTSLYAKRRAGKYLSQSFGLSAHILRNMDFSVPLNYSTRPLHAGW